MRSSAGLTRRDVVLAGLEVDQAALGVRERQPDRADAVLRRVEHRIAMGDRRRLGEPVALHQVAAGELLELPGRLES